MGGGQHWSRPQHILCSSSACLSWATRFAGASRDKRTRDDDSEMESSMATSMAVDMEGVEVGEEALSGPDAGQASKQSRQAGTHTAAGGAADLPSCAGHPWTSATSGSMPCLVYVSLRSLLLPPSICSASSPPPALSKRPFSPSTPSGSVLSCLPRSPYSLRQQGAAGVFLSILLSMLSPCLPCCLPSPTPPPPSSHLQVFQPQLPAGRDRFLTCCGRCYVFPCARCRCTTPKQRCC